jgi:hypothetical protein
LAGATVEEAHAKIIFKRFDLQPNRQLGEEQLLGRLRKLSFSATTRKTLRRKSFPTGAHPDYPPAGFFLSQLRTTLFH